MILHCDLRCVDAIEEGFVIIVESETTRRLSAAVKAADLLHDVTERLSVAAVDEAVGDHSAAFMVEKSGEELRALTHLSLHCQDALKRSTTIMSSLHLSLS